MRIRKTGVARSASGQSIIETVLMLPLLLLLLLNAVNFGYFFFTVLNLAASTRNGVEYAIMGFETPSAENLPSSGPATGVTGPVTVTYLAQQDMTGALSNPAGASIQVCSQTNLDASKSGTNGSGANQKTNCITCTGTTCGAVNTGAAGQVPDADPEAPSFLLNRVDVTYTFTPLIQGTPFNIALLPAGVCNAGATSCTFHRYIQMRAMN
jgi:hypothetical protein